MFIGWLCFIRVIVILIKFVCLVKFRISCLFLFIVVLIVIMFVRLLEISIVMMVIFIGEIFVYFVVVFECLKLWILYFNCVC